MNLELGEDVWLDELEDAFWGIVERLPISVFLIILVMLNVLVVAQHPELSTQLQAETVVFGWNVHETVFNMITIYLFSDLISLGLKFAIVESGTARKLGMMDGDAA